MKLFILENFGNLANLVLICLMLGVIQSVWLIVSFNLRDRRNNHIKIKEFIFFRKAFIIIPFILMAILITPENKEDFKIRLLPKTILNKGIILISNQKMGSIALTCPSSDMSCFSKINGMTTKTLNEIFLMKFCENNDNKLCKGVNEYARQFN